MERPNCDLVMKGGITSGIIYPQLIARLASKYQFKNIGGTSVGAIAAGACAAAEYGRIKETNIGAFEELANLPKVLSEVDENGASKLFTLFQPTPTLRNHFHVFTSGLNAKAPEAISSMLIELMKMHALLVMMGILLGGLILYPLINHSSANLAVCHIYAKALIIEISTVISLIVALCCVVKWPKYCLLVAIAFVGVAHTMLATIMGGTFSWHLAPLNLSVLTLAVLLPIPWIALIFFLFLRKLIIGLHNNDYGLCTGCTTDGGPEALTDWLVEYLQKLAGKPNSKDALLTFGDLWGTRDPKEKRNINLEVMTTAISQQMVYGIPFHDHAPKFYYYKEEWERLFPKIILDYLNSYHQAQKKAEITNVINQNRHELRPLPPPQDLPIVIALRMSLSFPILLSAIPLYAVDMSLTANQKIRQKKKEPERADKKPLVATRIWFSDGGIGSNMPLHMFDAFLPDHPTFAVNLKSPHPDFPITESECASNEGGRIYLPEDNKSGRIQYWPAPNDEQPLGGLIGFVAGIIGTMQNWRDEILFPYPGFRDRIVQISQRPDEGGLNLNMPASTIETLAKAGEMAADRLIHRFHPKGRQHGKGWNNHKLVRLRTFLGIVQPATTLFAQSSTNGSWQPLIKEIKYKSKQRQQLATKFLSQFLELGKLGNDSGESLEDGALKPRAEIRIVPRV